MHAHGREYCLYSTVKEEKENQMKKSSEEQRKSESYYKSYSTAGINALYNLLGSLPSSIFFLQSTPKSPIIGQVS